MLLMLSGAIGAGKDTFAELLLDAFEKYGRSAEIVKFADPIRNVAFAMGFNPDDRATKETPWLRVYKLSDLSDNVFNCFPYIEPFYRRLVACKIQQRLLAIRKERHNGVFHPVVSTREFMQVVGGCVREVDVNYYIKHLTASAPTNRVNIVSDCRFVNEQQIGDFAVYVYRPNNPHAVNTLDSSEQSQEVLAQRADHLINNDGSLDELAQAASNLAATLINRGKC